MRCIAAIQPFARPRTPCYVQRNIKGHEMNELRECDYYGESVATLGERISVAREHVNMSEEKLAISMAVQRQTISDWEGDGAEPRSNKLATLAGILGVSPVWLLTVSGEGIPSPEEESVEIDDTALRLRLAAELRDALEAQAQVQKRIGRIADALAAID